MTKHLRALELRKKSTGELASLLKEKLLRREELTLLDRQKKTKNVKELGGVRREVARIKTILRQGRQHL